MPVPADIAVGPETPRANDNEQGDGHPAVALTLLVVTLVIAAGALLLVVLNRPEWQVWQWYFVVDIADAFVFGVVGYLLLSRTSHPVAGIVVTCALGGAIAALGAQWTELTFQRPDVPTLALLQSTQNWAWIPGTLALFMIVPWLVRDTPIGTAPRIAISASIATIVAMVGFRLTNPFPWPIGDPIMPLAITRDGWQEQVETIDQWLMGATVILGLLATADVTRRWQADRARRRGLGWLAIGAGLMTGAFIPLALPSESTDWLPANTTPLLHLGSQLFYPAALLVAVLGQRLWGIQVAVNRTIAWSMLTALLIAAYVTLVGLSSLLMPGVDDNVERVIVTALVAAAIGPLRRFVQRRVDHLVHGDGREPMRIVHRVGHGVGVNGSPAELLEGVLDELVTALRLSGATIETDGSNGHAERTSTGDTAGHESTMVPLVLNDQLIGSLTVWPRPGERLDGQAQRALAALVPTIAVATRLAATAEQLADSRTRIAAARDDERRALRRELHDGLGPALAGIGYGLQAARNMIATDPDSSRRLLDRLAGELDARIEEVRTLARELVPPVLLDAGLAPALEQLVERHRLSGLTIELDVDQLPELPPALASALYGVTIEALRNVVRHAEATRCSVTLSRSGTELRLSIVDDGAGITPDAVSGVGLQSMRERADAIGSTLRVEPAVPHGTRVELVADLGSIRVST